MFEKIMFKTISLFIINGVLLYSAALSATSKSGSLDLCMQEQRLVAANPGCELEDIYSDLLSGAYNVSASDKNASIACINNLQQLDQSVLTIVENYSSKNIIDDTEDLRDESLKINTLKLNIEEPENDSIHESFNPFFAGRSIPGSTVSVFADDNKLGSALTNSDGEWSLISDIELKDGCYNITAKAKCEDDTYLSSNSVKITISLPKILQVPTLALYPQVSQSQTPFIIGNAQPGNIVSVYAQNESLSKSTRHIDLYDDEEDVYRAVLFVGQEPIGTATTDSTGRWVFVPSIDLAPGEYRFQFTVTDQEGNTSAATNPVNISVNPSSLLPIVINQSNDSLISGTAIPGSTVFIFADNKLISTTQVNPDSNWSYALNNILTPGSYNISVILRQPNAVSMQTAVTETTFANPVVAGQLNSAIRSKYFKAI